jgi:drug/metabolite transporter (DMT)-like permease
LSAASLVLIPVFLVIVKDTAWMEVPARGWAAIAWMTVLSSLAGYALWFHALGKGGISRISTLQLAMPGLTIAAAALVLNEAITVSMLVVAAVILAGTSWAHRHAR